MNSFILWPSYAMTNYPVTHESTKQFTIKFANHYPRSGHHSYFVGPIFNWSFIECSLPSNNNQIHSSCKRNHSIKKNASIRNVNIKFQKQGYKTSKSSVGRVKNLLKLKWWKR